MLDVFLLLILSAIFTILAAMMGKAAKSDAVTKFLALGVLVRLVGSNIRWEVMERFYNGIGDAKQYFGWGRVYAGMIGRGDFSFIDFENYRGTEFVRWCSAFVVFVVGDNPRTCFFLFAMAGWGGLVLIARGAQETYGKEIYPKMLAWLLLWPSLWYWPASIGKDTLMLLALGLVVRGFAGDRGRILWGPVVAGLALSGFIRPHVSAALAVSVGAADLLGAAAKNRPPWQRRLQLVAILLVSVFVAYESAVSMVGDVDLEGLQEEYQFRAGQTQQGGSEITPAPGLLQIPMAFVNVYMRPFPWEASNGLAFIAALEIWSVWFFVWMRRKGVLSVIKRLRRDRVLTVAAPIAAIIGLMFGVTFFNMGIIARQRTIVLPLLLLVPIAARHLVTVEERARRARVPERRPKRRPVPGSVGLSNS